MQFNSDNCHIFIACFDEGQNPEEEFDDEIEAYGEYSPPQDQGKIINDN